jgi:hypothetical protein
MRQKELKDLRGPQRRIARLASFNLEAFIHELVYRIMVPLTLAYALLLIAYLVRGTAGGALGAALKVVTAVVWLLWTPQLFEVAKGLSLAWSRGMAFGSMNPEFAALYRKRYAKRSGAYVALPFLVLAAWLAGFIVMLVRWAP